MISKSTVESVLEPLGDEGDLIPDFLLQPFNSPRFCDVLDIKTPAASVMVLQKNRERFSSAVWDGVAQLRRYAEYFDDPRLRHRVAHDPLRRQVLI
jgi:hypothetical protein